MSNYLKEFFSNPDNTISTKRTIGTFSVLVAAVITIVTVIKILLSNEPNYAIIVELFFGWLAFAATCLGISSYDNKQWLNAPATPTVNENLTVENP